MTRCQITVLSKYVDEKYPIGNDFFPNFEPCNIIKEKDAFITRGKNGDEMPAGFCRATWDSIKNQVNELLINEKDNNVHVVCCNDGVRHVFFKLEPIKEA